MFRKLRRLFRSVFGPGPTEGERRNARYDAETVEVMRRVLSDDSGCVDVGCHRGTMLDEMLRCAPNGRHFGFEPIPELAAQLEKRYGKRDNVTIHRVALSDSAGRSTFAHVVTNPGYSGLRERRYDRDDERVETIEVETARLDDLLPDGVRIRFVKIDVEGGELGVLRGAASMLRRDRPVIVFEHGVGSADRYGTEPDHVFDVLTDCGLEVTTMRRWLAGEPPHSRDTFCEAFRKVEDFYFLAGPKSG